MQKITTLLIAIGLFSNSLLHAQDNCEPVPEVNFPGGRVILSFDGNVHDDDDIVAMPYAAGLWWAAGLQDKVVQIEYNNHVCAINSTEGDGVGPGTGDDSANMRNSAQGIIDHFGYNPDIIFDYETQDQASTAFMAEQIEQSTASNKLWIIAGGPMETVWRALNMASQGHNHVIVISHSPWNEEHAHCTNAHAWADLVSDFTSQGVFFVGSCSSGGCTEPGELDNQNGGFNSAPSNWQWMANSSYEYNRWIFSRNPFGGKFDPSDAGMSYFLITGGPFNGGNKKADHNDARQLMENPCDDTGHETDSSNSSGGNCNYDFEEVNGRVIIEAESINTPGNWQKNSAASGYTGSGYIEWVGSNHFNSPGNGTTNTTIKISTPGTYLFQWRSKVGHGTNHTESNDTWLRFPDADDFFGRKDNGHTVYPKGSGKTPNPEGASADNWFKVFMNSLNWSWDAKTSDNDGHKIYVTFDSPGVYTMQLSGRSAHHLIDRIVLARDPAGSTQLDLEETICADTGEEPIAVTGLNLTPTSVTLEVGQQIQLNAQIIPENATNRTLNWSFTNEAVATVNTQGLVTAAGVGTGVIRVTSEDGNYSRESEITVIAPQEEEPEDEPEEEPLPENSGSFDDCKAEFMEYENRVVIEAELMNYPQGWSMENDAEGHTGAGYVEWQGDNQFQSPGTGTITASIEIHNPGTYLFQWHTKVGYGTNSTESNDSWLRFPDAADFFGENGAGSIIYPKGSGKSPVPNGAGADGWFKVFSRGTTNWTWSTLTSDNDGHQIYVTFDTPGTYSMEIAGRSNGHFIDRIVLSRAGVEATDLSLESTSCSERQEQNTTEAKPSLSIQSPSVYEGGELEFVFTLSKPIDEDVLLLIDVEQGTAQANDYFKPGEEGVVILAGETSATFLVPTKNDPHHEENETVILQLEEVSDSILGSFDDEITGVILDDDAPMNINPNPARSSGIVELGGLVDGTYQISLFSMSGELIQNFTAEISGVYEFRLPSIGKGLYILRADSPRRAYSAKLAVK